MESREFSMSGAKPRLGFIGIGLMGQPMALRLLAADYRVAVWNRTPGKLDAVVAAGAVAAATPDALTFVSDIIMLCVLDAASVEQVVFGENGVAKGATPDKLLIDFTSAAPNATQSMAESLKADTGMGWIDAPVSGGVAGAAAGKLAILAGGQAADIALVTPILEHLANQITHFGPAGAGQTAKLCNQLIVGTNLSVIAEAIHLAEMAGIEAAKLPVALKGGFADSTPLQIFGTRFAARQSEPVLGHVQTMLKDLDTAHNLSKSLGTSLPVADAARARLHTLADQGRADNDIGALMDLFDTKN